MTRKVQFRCAEVSLFHCLIVPIFGFSSGLFTRSEWSSWLAVPHSGMIHRGLCLCERLTSFSGCPKLSGVRESGCESLWLRYDQVGLNLTAILFCIFFLLKCKLLKINVTCGAGLFLMTSTQAPWGPNSQWNGPPQRSSTTPSLAASLTFGLLVRVLLCAFFLYLCIMLCFGQSHHSTRLGAGDPLRGWEPVWGQGTRLGAGDPSGGRLWPDLRPKPTASAVSRRRADVGGVQWGPHPLREPLQRRGGGGPEAGAPAAEAPAGPRACLPAHGVELERGEPPYSIKWDMDASPPRSLHTPFFWQADRRLGHLNSHWCNTCTLTVAHSLCW